MKTKLLATLLLAGSSLFAAPRVGFGIGIGVPVAPPVAAYVPPCPGPGYEWNAGRWVFRGRQEDSRRRDVHRPEFGRDHDFGRR